MQLPKTKILHDNTEIIDALNRIRLTKDIVAFDIETSGIKPYNKDHFIYSVSLCTNDLLPLAFLYTPEIQTALKRLLMSPKVKKIAHNISFEHNWIRCILGYEVQNWYWDTCLAAHIINNQTKVGLKYLVMKAFDVEDYDKEIKPYLKAEGSNGLNRIKEAPVDKLLEYNGWDSFYSFKLYDNQVQSARLFQLHDALGLFMKGTIALADISFNGFAVDIQQCRDQQSKLKDKIEQELAKICRMDDYRLWAKIFRTKLNLNSTAQLKNILYEQLKHKITKRTAKGNPSVDKEALESINTPFVHQLLTIRKYQKATKTYLENIIKSTGEDNKLHCSYNLGAVSSFRGSSSSPNLQNVPLRDQEIGPLIRNVFMPHPNQELVEVDYASLEVRIGCCYHQDPQMINYIRDNTTDMHRDCACDCFLLQPGEVTDAIRYEVKGNFVFAQQYGSYYVLCAKQLWKNCLGLQLKNGMAIKRHLETKNIDGYRKFEAHLKRVENDFWTKRFKTYGIWRDNQVKFFEKHKYLKSLTGFRYGGYMKRNQCYNFAIQGSAFHVLLKSIILINAYLANNQLQSKIVNQIHDSIIFSVVPSEKQKLLPVIKRIMTEDVKYGWDWLILPLKVDVKEYGINNPWVKTG